MVQKYKIPTKARAAERKFKIPKPRFSDKNIEDSLANEEDEILKRDQGTQPPLPDGVKLATIMIETNGAIRGRIRLNARALKKYSGVKRAMMNNFRSRHNFQGPTSSDTAPMDVDALERRQRKERQRKRKEETKGEGKGKREQQKGKEQGKWKGKGARASV